MTSAELLSIILGTVGSIVTALGRFIIAYLHQKTKRLEAKISTKDTQIQTAHNGFRHEVYTRLGELEKEIAVIRTDTNLIKEFILKGKKDVKAV